MIGLEIGVTQAQKTASAPSFDPAIEYMPDTGWDNAGVWTPSGSADVNATVPSALYIPDRFSGVSGTAAHLLAPGTYRYTDTILSANGAPASVSTTAIVVGGTTAFIPGGLKSSLPLAVQVDIVVATVTNQNIIIGSGSQSRSYPNYGGGSLKRIA